MARILVIEDEPSVRQLVMRARQHAGHTLYEAGDGKDALKQMQEQPFDIVITDVYMPDMDGIEFTIRLRKQSPRPGLITMSGGGFMEKETLLETARRLGADATLAKPFSVDELMGAVNDLLKRGEEK